MPTLTYKMGDRTIVVVDGEKGIEQLSAAMDKMKVPHTTTTTDVVPKAPDAPTKGLKWPLEQ